MEKSAVNRAISSIKEILPKTLKTCLWLIRITTLITLGVLFLEYFEILPYLSRFLSPVFNLMGLPGEAALAYVTGYFVNVYSAIAVISTLDLDARSITILSVMVLCSHNMITETAVQKKTGSSAIRMVFIRTLSAFVLGFVLNLIMPEAHGIINSEIIQIKLTLPEMLQVWFYKTLHLIVLMTVLIFTLSILQRLLA